jgi:hypothetical protein
MLTEPRSMPNEDGLTKPDQEFQRQKRRPDGNRRAFAKDSIASGYYSGRRQISSLPSKGVLP